MKVVIAVLFYLLVVSVPSFAEDIDDYKITVVEEGRHGPITFIVTIDPAGKIKNMRVVKNNELRGRKINKKRFLRQFTGKGTNDPIRLRKDIDAVTSATISSNAAARAARKALEAWEIKFN